MADIFTVLRGGYRAAKGMKKGDQDKFLSRLELQALLQAAAADRRKYGVDARDLFFLSGNFGLRCSEAIDLELGDFKTLHLGYFRVRTLKRRGEIEDRVYTGLRGAERLRTLVDRRRAAGYTARIFPFTSRTARYLFAFYAKRAGLSPNISFHSLRHTAARMMLEATGGGDPTKGSMRIVNCFLRHKPTTTEIYTTPSPEEMTRAIEQKGIVE